MTMGSNYDPDELRRHIQEQTENIGMQAEIDQFQARLAQQRDNATWWAALMVLCEERGDQAATAVAAHNLKSYLHQFGGEDLVTLTAYLLHNTVMLISKYEEGGDIPLMVSNLIGAENMLAFEKFAATGGASCPECGANDGWDGHPCGGGHEQVEG